jgi:cysteine desulfurase
MEKELLKGLDGCFVNGNREKRLPNSLNISFSSANAQRLVKRLAPLALSTGSACTSASPEPSYVLKAMGVPEKLRKSAIRFGLGRFTTAKEVRQAVGRVVQNVKRLRQ